jgi:hypothetical protein
LDDGVSVAVLVRVEPAFRAPLFFRAVTLRAVLFGLRETAGFRRATMIQLRVVAAENGDEEDRFPAQMWEPVRHQDVGNSGRVR